MTALNLTATTRETTGKGPARTLRRAGMIPAIIYGKGKKEVMITVSQRDVQLLHNKFTYMSTPVDISLDGKIVHVLPKAVLLHPVSDMVEHADFVFLNEGEKIKVKVPLLFTGKDRSVGLKRGGVLNAVLRNLTLMVDAKAIPSVVEIDIANLEIGSAIYLKDIKLPKGCAHTILDLNYTVAKVVGKKEIKLDEEEVAVNAIEADKAAAAAAGDSDKDKDGKDKKEDKSK